jgi:hypothetical protein
MQAVLSNFRLHLTGWFSIFTDANESIDMEGYTMKSCSAAEYRPWNILFWTLVFSAVLLVSGPSYAQQPSDPPDWSSWQSMMGEWAGESGGSPAFSHEDLTVIYQEPRFRLIYAKTSDGTLVQKFEMAPPGKPEAFKTYIESTARRK